MIKSFLISLVLLSSVAFADPIVFMQERGEEKNLLLWRGTDLPSKVATPYAFNIYPDISHDGKYLAFIGGSSETTLNVVIKDLTRDTLTEVTPERGTYFHPNFSGDARYLAFVEDRKSVV